MSYSIHLLGDIYNPEPALELNGKVNEGVVKLAQRVLILLFSDKRTELYGTGLPELLEAGANVLLDNLENLARIAVDDVIDIINQTTPDLPDDESPERIDIGVAAGASGTGTADITLDIYTRAGNSLRLKLPKTFTGNM